VATTIARLQAVLSAETRDFDRAMGKSEGRMKGMAKAAILSGGAAGVGLLAVGLKKSVDAAVEAEKSQVRMQTQLKALNISFNRHGAEIDRTIQAHSRLSGFDDEDLQDSFTGLVRVTGDHNKALKANALAMDIARARGTDLDSASKLVTRALMGNSGALRRVGIDIDKNASKQQIMAALQRKFGGQAEAYGKTAAGAQDRLRVAFENVMEQLGQKLLPLLVRFLNWVVGTAIPGLERMIQKVRGVIGAFRDFGERVSRTLATARERFNTFRESVGNNVDRVVNRIGDIWRGVSSMVTGVKERLEALVAFFRDLPGRLWKFLKGIPGLIKKAFTVDLPDINVPFLGGGPPAGGKPFPVSGVSSALWDEIGLGRAMGLALTSGLRPGDMDSKHGYGKAIDMAGSAGAMRRFAQAAMRRPGIDEVFYDPLGYFMDRGRIVRGSIGGHSDHVHVGIFDKPGWHTLAKGLNVIGNFTGKPEPVWAAGGGSVPRGGATTIIVPVVLNGREILRVVADEQGREHRRNGR
jgi:hypothetical protein